MSDISRLFPALVLSTLFLSACGGKGVDAKLNTSGEEAYRISLAKAFEEMTPEQQGNFNWAVENYALYTFFAKYPNPTPRQVINKELDAYEKRMKEELADLAANMAKDAAKLKAQDEQTAQALAEVNKIVATKIGLKKDWSGDYTIMFTTENGSLLNISQADWTLYTYLDGHEQPDYQCRLSAYYSIHGGLAAGKSLGYDTDTFSTCHELNNQDVVQAKKRVFAMRIQPESVKDYGKRSVIPEFEVTTRMYEKEIKARKENLEGAAKARASLS